MAIKLADVIERSNTAYPVLEAHDKTIVGFYNGAASTAQPLKLYYDGLVKTSVSEDGQANTPIQLTSSYVTGTPSSGQVAANTADSLLGAPGGIVTMLDEKLKSSSGSFPSPNYSAAYLTQVVPAGSQSDTNRHVVERYSELCQQFDRYVTVTGQQAVALGEETGEDFLFAGFSTKQNRMRAITMAELISGIGSQLTADLISSGVITEGQGTGSGGIGDVNGDGAVSSADLLLFLTQFGTQDAGFATDYKTLFGTQSVDGVSIGVAPDPSNPFAESDLTNWSYGSTVTTDGDAYGFTSVSFPTSAANFVRFNTMNLGVGNALLTSHWNQRHLLIELSATVTFSAPDAIYAVCHVILTGAGGSATTEEVMVVSAGTDLNFNQNQNGLYTSSYYDDVAGGVPVGPSVAWEVNWDFKPEGFTERYPVATNYANHDSDLEEGFLMNHTLSSGFNIKNVEVRIHFAGTNGAASVDIEQVRHRIIAL
jgi:hypothetical protein